MIKIKEFINKKLSRQQSLIALPIYTKESKTTRVINIQNGSTFKSTLTQSNGVFKRVVIPVPIFTKAEVDVVTKDYYDVKTDTYLFSEESILHNGTLHSERTFHKKNLLL